eukprot:6341905-Amphidinium_carterae.1
MARSATCQTSMPLQEALKLTHFGGGVGDGFLLLLQHGKHCFSLQEAMSAYNPLKANSPSRAVLALGLGACCQE